MNHHKVIKSSLVNNTVVIETEFGYTIEAVLEPLVTIDPITQYPDNLPDMTAELKIISLKTQVTPTCVKQDQIANILNERGIIPPNLAYDHVLIGFVYSDISNPNNHQWWLDFRKGNGSVYNYFGDNIQLHCPINTYSWPDAGFSHGRFKLSKADIDSIKEQNGTIIIKGKFVNLPIATGESIVTVDYDKLRLRYSPRTDLWYCDVLAANDIVLETIEATSIICNVDPLLSNRLDIGGKPKISMLAYKQNIGSVVRVGNTLILTGKTN